MRPVNELVEVADPAWPQLRDALRGSGPSTRILAVERAVGERCIHRLQVTARSTLGALALNTGGVTIEHGWLRHLGGGGDGLPDLAEANGLGDPSPASQSPPTLLVAFDVLGGRFAVNGGGLTGAAGEVSYWAPDTLRWEPTGLGHTEFVQWSMTDRLDAFYRDLRWEGWQDEVGLVRLDQGLSVYPPLWTRESRPISGTSRRPVPWDELTLVLDDLARQLDGG